MALAHELAAILQDILDSKLLDVHTALPGRVQTYDPTTQTATVVPCVKRAYLDGDDAQQLEDLPVIPNVPVMWPRGGGFAVHLPLKAGDHVLLVFSEANTTSWRNTGEPSEPGHLGRHNLSSPFAIPGAAPQIKPIPPTLASGSSMKLGTEDGAVVVDISEAGVIIGSAIPVAQPVAKAPPTLNAIAALQLEVVALSAAITALAQPTSNIQFTDGGSAAGAIASTAAGVVTAQALNITTAAGLIAALKLETE